jgi:signal transduction histidine kinase
MTEQLMPMTEELEERLASHRTLAGAPRQELEWLVAHGHLETLPVGDVISVQSRPVAGTFIVLSGRISIHILKGSARHKVAEWRAGDVTGALPYSRLVTPPGDTVVEEPVEMLVILREHLPAMIRECHEVTSILVHVMLDRARFFTSTMLHDEKLKSLGKLAAGLAHELNNPAAAITRLAKMLGAGIESAENSARTVGAAGLLPAELTALRETIAACLAMPIQQVRSPLEEAEREAEIADWLNARGIDAAAAESVARSPVTVATLEQLTRAVRPETLGPALRWLAADCSVRHLAWDIEQAGARISDLVTAVRGFTQVDVSDVPRAVDVAVGLRQTLAVLQGKARNRAIRVTVTMDDDLPRVRGVAAELNQIWANLVDNALDAAPASGTVEVRAARRGEVVEVRVADNGPGIPAEIRERIFDPFFTTKDVGKGTGLGLDIVRRLVDRHDGDIEVISEPGRTEFIVSLPRATRDEQG